MVSEQKITRTSFTLIPRALSTALGIITRTSTEAKGNGLHYWVTIRRGGFFFQATAITVMKDGILIPDKGSFVRLGTVSEESLLAVWESRHNPSYWEKHLLESNVSRLSLTSFTNSLARMMIEKKRKKKEKKKKTLVQLISYGHNLERRKYQTKATELNIIKFKSSPFRRPHCFKYASSSFSVQSHSFSAASVSFDFSEPLPRRPTGQ